MSGFNRSLREGCRPGRGPAGILILLVAVLVGCDADPPTSSDRVRLDGLEFTGGVNVAESFPVQLGFFLQARNTTVQELHLVSDGCGVLPRAYREPDRAGEPAWDTRPGAPCLALVAPVTLAPGESKRFTRSYSARDVLGDSLPDGRYFFTVTYRASLSEGSESRLLEVAAGEAELVLP